MLVRVCLASMTRIRRPRRARRRRGPRRRRPARRHDLKLVRSLVLSRGLNRVLSLVPNLDLNPVLNRALRHAPRPQRHARLRPPASLLVHPALPTRVEARVVRPRLRAALQAEAADHPAAARIHPRARVPIRVPVRASAPIRAGARAVATGRRMAARIPGSRVAVSAARRSAARAAAGDSGLRVSLVVAGAAVAEVVVEAAGTIARSLKAFPATRTWSVKRRSSNASPRRPTPRR